MEKEKLLMDLFFYTSYCVMSGTGMQHLTFKSGQVLADILNVVCSDKLKGINKEAKSKAQIESNLDIYF
jgi:hypothetical protein